MTSEAQVDNKSGVLLVFTATYNEIDNATELLNDIWSTNPCADVLVVDDNSPDGTGALLDRIATTESRLTVVHRPAKLGLGTAHTLARTFSFHGGSFIFCTLF